MKRLNAHPTIRELIKRKLEMQGVLNVENKLTALMAKNNGRLPAIGGKIR